MFYTVCRACVERGVNGRTWQVDEQEQAIYDELEEWVVGHLVVDRVAGELEALEKVADGQIGRQLVGTLPRVAPAGKLHREQKLPQFWQPEVAVNYSCLFFLSFYNLFVIT